MLCKQCGTQCHDSAKFCITCGAPLEAPITAQPTPPPQVIIQNPPPQQAPIYVVPERKPTDSSKVLAIIALITGILSMVSCFCCGFISVGYYAAASVVPGIAAIICGAISKKKKKKPNGMATAGLWLGIAGTVIGPLTTIITTVIMLLIPMLMAMAEGM